MRPKIVLAVLLIGMLPVVLILIVGRPRSSSSATGLSSDAVPDASAGQPGAASPEGAARMAADRGIRPAPGEPTATGALANGASAAGETTEPWPAASRPSATLPVGSEENLRAFIIHREIAEIEEAQSSRDPSAGAVIRVKLESLQREVRMAAVQALKEMDDVASIPALIELAARTDEARDRVAILDAAEFLQLPGMKAALAQRAPRPSKLARDAVGGATPGRARNPFGGAGPRR